MKFKNQLIQNLVSNGLEATTDHSLEYKDAYKIFKFKKGIADANKAIEEKRQELVKTAGIEDGQKFDERRKELEALPQMNEAEQKEYDEMLEKLKKFGELYNELLNDESEVEIKTISFEAYHKLANENKQVPVTIPGKDKPQTILVDFYMAFREPLKDKLWIEPED